MKHPKGLIPIVIVIFIAIISAGVVGMAWYYNQHKDEVTIQGINTNIAINESTNTELENTAEQGSVSYSFQSQTDYDSIIDSQKSAGLGYNSDNKGIELNFIQSEKKVSETFKNRYNGGYIYDIQCNDDYCLVEAGSASWTYKFVKYQNGEFTDLTDLLPSRENGGSPKMHYAWNGKMWLILDRGIAYSYDGEKMEEIGSPLNENFTFTALYWDGENWLLGAFNKFVKKTTIPIYKYDDSDFSILTQIDGEVAITKIAGTPNNLVIVASNNNGFNMYKLEDQKILTTIFSRPHTDEYCVLPDMVYANELWMFGTVNCEEENQNPPVMQEYIYDGSEVKNIKDQIILDVPDDVVTADGTLVPMAANLYKIINDSDGNKYYSLTPHVVPNNIFYIHNNIIYGDIKNGGGFTEYTLGYKNGRAQSRPSIVSIGGVNKVTLSADMIKSKSTNIKFYISKDEESWQETGLNQEYTFNDPWNTLYWKIEMSTDDPNISPTLKSITIDYETTNESTEYKNETLGFSIKAPNEIMSNFGACEWNEEPFKYREGNDHSYRSVDALVPTKIFEDDDSVYISTEYYYELIGKTEETVDGGGVYYTYSGCEKTENSLEHLKDSQNYYAQNWKFIVSTVNDDTDIDNAIKEQYGQGCSLGEKTPSDLQEGVYDIRIKGDGKDLGETECPVNYATKLKYYPKKNLLITWDLGQAPTFWISFEPPASYDDEMVESFRFL